MKRKNIVIISMVGCLIILIAVLIIHSFFQKKVEVNKYQDSIERNVNLTIKFDRLLNDDEYEDFSDYIKLIANVPDECNKIAKLTINLDNKSDFSLYGFISSVDSQNLFMVSECIDIEPTDYIYINSSITVNAYIYISDDLNSYENIVKELKNTDFEFLFFIDNNKSLMEPYKVYKKAKWINA